MRVPIPTLAAILASPSVGPVGGCAPGAGPRLVDDGRAPPAPAVTEVFRARVAGEVVVWEVAQ